MLSQYWLVFFFFLSLQFSRQPDYSEQFSQYGYPSSSTLSSYFSSEPEATSNGSLPSTTLNKVISKA